MSIKDKFFDATNFEILFYVVTQDLKHRFNYEIEETMGKQELFNIMNKIYIKYPNKNIIELNKLTLNYIAPLLKNKYEETKKTNKERNNPLNRDMIYNKRTPTFVDMRPESIEKGTIENLDMKYTEISQRYQEHKPEPINFNSPLTDNNNTDMMTDIQKLQQMRDTSYQEGEQNIKDKILNVENNLEGSTNINELINN